MVLCWMSLTKKNNPSCQNVTTSMTGWIRRFTSLVSSLTISACCNISWSILDKSSALRSPRNRKKWVLRSDLNWTSTQKALLSYHSPNVSGVKLPCAIKVPTWPLIRSWKISTQKQRQLLKCLRLTWCVQTSTVKCYSLTTNKSARKL